MDNTTLYLLIGFASVSIILMIGFGVFYSKKNKKDKAFKAEAASSGKGILNIYGAKIEINNQPISELEHSGSAMTNYIVPVAPGDCKVKGEYSISIPVGGKNRNFTCKNIELNFQVEAGKEYNLGIGIDPRALSDSISYVECEPTSGGTFYVICHYSLK